MRLATLGLAVILLVGMTPALAHTAEDAEDAGDEWHSPDNGEGVPGYHTIKPGIPYAENLTVENDAYLKGGWWADGAIGEGLSLDQDDTGNATDPDQEIMWVRIQPGDNVPTVPYEVTVETEGPVIAAMDVFRVQRHTDGGGWITPNCPQFVVEDLYPQEGEGLGWLFRVAHETSDYHQRDAAPVGGSMSVDLNPDRAPSGYVVAVYPQAGTGSEQASDTLGETDIDLTVGIASGEFVLWDSAEIHQQPEQPYDTDQWVGGIGDLLECAGEGIEVPPPLQESQAAELPGPGSVEQRVGSLFEASLG